MNALYYPFHLCHERTLMQLLEEYESIHFRDFMALQLTPMMGTTAFPDRMGDYYPAFKETGRIIQGHNLSGAIGSTTMLAINRDLADATWRKLFQNFLQTDPRFQRGLFPKPKETTSSQKGAAATPQWLQFGGKQWATTSIDVETIQQLSMQRLQKKDAAYFDYGWAMIKTAASLIYTIQLCHTLNLVAVTDSMSHYTLLEQTYHREQMKLKNALVKPERY